MGIPVVTLEGEYARGRVSAYMHRHMGMMDCIAHDAGGYVNIALRLGRNAERRNRISEAILARNDVLFDNDSGSAELVEIFLEIFGQ